MGFFAPLVIEAGPRRVVGWSMSPTMTSQLVTDALIMAIWRRGNLSVEGAGQAYGEAMMQMMAGNPPEMTTGFTFEVTTADVGDADETTLK